MRLLLFPFSEFVFLSDLQYHQAEMYQQNLRSLELYHTERGGVGLAEFIAFNDALNISEIKATIAVRQRDEEAGAAPINGRLLERAKGTLEAANLIYRSHEVEYDNFADLYDTARTHINQAVKQSPYYRETTYLDLHQVRANFVRSSSRKLH